VKKFRFRLQKVLDVRRIRERQEQEKLHQAIHRRMEEEKRLGLLDKEERDMLQMMRSGRETSFEIWNYTADTRYRVRIGEAKVKQTGRIQQASEQEEVRRQSVTQARRQTRVLEKLRELRYDEWAREMSRQEDNVLDEIASHRRKVRELAE
jgi:flagellar FliJ protein